MDSANIGKVILMGIVGIALFMIITRVIPRVIAITSGLLGMLVSFAIVAIVTIGLVGFLRRRLK